MVNTFFAYLRISTIKQGSGVSLQEQRLAIERYAELHHLTVVSWFEETRTAAKRGREEFNRMLSLARQRQVRGVILHKIDRGARNLRDWADLGELLDSGIEIRVAGDGLDLSSRSGRLAADIQAVVAADYVRNLKEEARKGVLGRLRQGLYPYTAPLGYVNRGPGKVKSVDSGRAALIILAFELYATGEFTLSSLEERMAQEGLRTNCGRPVHRSSWATTLSNPFYIGSLVDRATGQLFAGMHRPIISSNLFDRVQRILHDRQHPGRRLYQQHAYSHLIRCKHCALHLTAELHKGHVYYRCHGRTCPLHHCLREERLEDLARQLISNDQATKSEIVALLCKGWVYDGTGLTLDLGSNTATPSGRMGLLEGYAAA